MPRLHRPIIALTAIFILVGVHYTFTDPSSSRGTDSSWTSYRDAISNRDGGALMGDGTKVGSGARRTRFGEFGLFGKSSPQPDPVEGVRDARAGEAAGPEGVLIDKRGLTVYDGHAALDRHPIEALIERGKRLAAAQQAKWDEVESLDDSVDDYTVAFGMAPPKGYDVWYTFADSIKPASNTLPSLMPLVHEPIVPMLSHDGATLRERIVDMRETGSGAWTFTFVPPGTGDRGLACEKDQDWHPGNWHDRGQGRLLVRGNAAWSWRCNNTLELFLPMLPLMPPELFTQDPPFEMAFTLNDGPISVVHDTFKERSEKLGRAGKVWPKAQLDKAEQGMRWTHGWQWMCPEGSPVKVANTDMVLNDLDPIVELGAETDAQKTLGVKSSHPKSFIANTDAAADFCNNPDMLPYHNMLLMDNFISPGPYMPCIGQCRTARSSDIVGVPLDAVWVEFVPWSGKTINKAFWRGSTTGLFHKKGLPWRQSQRERLHTFAQNDTAAPLPILIDRTSQNKGVVVEEYPMNQLNQHWIDAGVSGEPVQCDQDDGTCDEMAREIKFLGRVRKEFGAQYKYVLDIDGNGWSSRFRRLLLGNNVVLKSTIYPEWFSGMLIPWYHYVPLKLDYTDLHDIMAFFIGAPDGSTPGRDDLAEVIAKNGVDFVESRWRNHDMQSYMFLLTLEYWRMVQDDRKAYSYVSS